MWKSVEDRFGAVEIDGKLHPVIGVLQDGEVLTDYKAYKEQNERKLRETAGKIKAMMLPRFGKMRLCPA